MAKFIHGRAVINALVKQGIADDQTRRVVIDIPVDGIPVIHLEKYGDTRLLEVITPIAKVAVTRTPAAAFCGEQAGHGGECGHLVTNGRCPDHGAVGPEDAYDRHAREALELQDLLTLVCRTVTLDTIASWTPAQRQQATDWAVAVHLNASDNPVHVPAEPAHVVRTQPNYTAGPIPTEDR